jgi:hypothetical protein
MAEFCVAVRMSPDEYKALTLVEYQELSRAYSLSKGSDLEDFI